MKQRILTAAIAAALGATAGVPALAQEPAGARSGQAIEEIVVRSRRVEEKLQEVPLAITALNTEQIERSGIVSLGDLQKSIPAVRLQQATGRAQASVFGIRGQKGDDVLLTSDQAVVVNIGDVPMMYPYGIGQFGPLDAASLEVAKGPQGTLFGKNTTGGAIIITPNEPGDEFGGRIMLGGGSDNLGEMQGVINVPINDVLAGRAAISIRQRDGTFTVAEGGPDGNDISDQSLRASLKWSPTDTVTNLTTFTYFHTYTTGLVPTKFLRAKGTATLGAGYVNALNKYKNDDFWTIHGDSDCVSRTLTNRCDNGFQYTKTWSISDRVTWEITPNVTFKNIFSYQELDLDGLIDLDGVNRFDVRSPLPAPFGPALSNIRFSSRQFTTAQAYTEEAQLIGKTDKVDWIAGVFYTNLDGRDGSWSDQFSNNQTVRETGPAGGLENTSVAVFAQGTYHWTDQTNVTLGFRYTKDDRSVTYNSHFVTNAPAISSCLITDPNLRGSTLNGLPNPTGLLPSNACALPVSTSFDEPTWLASIDHKIADGQMVYFKQSRGYRSGGLPGRGQDRDTGAPFGPEIVNDYEIGYKGELLPAGRPFVLNAALYYQDYQDVQRNVAFVVGTTLLNTVRNAASATIYGGELEITWLPTDDLELKAYYAYTNAGYDEWQDSRNVGATRVTFSRAENDFANVPEHSASVTARYRLPFSDEVGNIGRIL
ncbi:MAG: TonB-dependent receptor [Gammaproteobacteria bacterium]